MGHSQSVIKTGGSRNDQIELTKIVDEILKEISKHFTAASSWTKYILAGLTGYVRSNTCHRRAQLAYAVPGLDTVLDYPQDQVHNAEGRLDR